MARHHRKYVDKKLLTRFRMFAVIFLVMLGIAVYDVIVGKLDALLGLGSLAGGILLGLLIGRIYNVVWHEEAGKAIAKMDVFGTVILIAYIAFDLFRKKIFGHWLSGSHLSAFFICLSAGIMLGRLFTLRNRVMKVLRAQGL